MEYRVSPRISSDGAKGTVVVAHEIFGLTPHIRSLCDRLAAAGYAALAPDLFSHELQGGFLPYTAEGKSEGLRIKEAIGEAKMAAQIEALVAGAGGRVGVMGFCLGGLLAWLAAARPGVACAVGYYAVGLERHMSSRPQCPVLLHFGRTDPSIPAATVSAVRKAYPQVEVCEYDAGHAFNRDDDRSFHAASAQLAWERTLSFYAKTFQ